MTRQSARRLLLQISAIAAVLAPCLVTTSAAGHVFISPDAAPAASTNIFAFGIDHGCAGEDTTTFRARIPEGIVAVLPVVKPGWTVETIDGRYESPHRLGEVELRGGTVEVRWTGGAVPDGFYDEFLIRARVADDVSAGTTIWFPVVQECPNAVHRWIGIPHEGEPVPEEPAPGLRVVEQGEVLGAANR